MNMETLLVDFRSEALTAVVYISHSIIGFALFQNVIYLVQLVLAYVELRRKRPISPDSTLWHMLTSDITQPISLFAPAYTKRQTLSKAFIRYWLCTIPILKSSSSTMAPRMEHLKH